MGIWRAAGQNFPKEKGLMSSLSISDLAVGVVSSRDQPVEPSSDGILARYSAAGAGGASPVPLAGRKLSEPDPFPRMRNTTLRRRAGRWTPEKRLELKG